ncbi:COPI associated protein, putative [Plasmodium sp. gorilla clade G3]|nr:COPI associated protein, putative [Plasmodium sp. gorilla clade G3]
MALFFTDLPNFSLRFLSMISGTLMITAGILNVFNLFQTVVNIYVICSGILLILCDVKTFRFYRFIEFLFTVIGRSLFILIIGSIIIHKGILNLFIGLVLICISLMYITLGYYNGIPQPLMDRKKNPTNYYDSKNNGMSTCSMDTTNEV